MHINAKLYKVISEFISGIDAYGRAGKYYFKPFAVKYILLSGLLSLVFFLVLMGVIFQWGDNLGLSIIGLFTDGDLADWLSKLIRAVSVVLLWTIVVFIFKYLVIIIIAPIMSILSEKVEQLETGKPLDLKLSIWDQLYLMLRGLRLALSNIGRELTLTFILLLLSLIPGFIIFTTPMIFVVQAYYAGFGNLDLFMERHFDVKGSRAFVGRHKAASVANGAVFLALLLIPFVGAFLAPAISTMAATVTGVELLEKDDFS